MCPKERMHEWWRGKPCLCNIFLKPRHIFHFPGFVPTLANKSKGLNHGFCSIVPALYLSQARRAIEPGRWMDIIASIINTAVSLKGTLNEPVLTIRTPNPNHVPWHTFNTQNTYNSHHHHQQQPTTPIKPMDLHLTFIQQFI